MARRDVAAGVIVAHDGRVFSLTSFTTVGGRIVAMARARSIPRDLADCRAVSGTGASLSLPRSRS